MSETNDSTSAEPLGENEMFVEQANWDLTAMPGLTGPEIAIIWLKLPKVDGRSDELHSRNQQIEQCDASEEINVCENRKTRTWQERM